MPAVQAIGAPAGCWVCESSEEQRTEIMRCPECQFDNPLGLVSCTRCGRRLESTPAGGAAANEVAEAELLCPACHGVMPSYAVFCGMCGQRLQQSAVAGKAALPSQSQGSSGGSLASTTEFRDKQEVREQASPGTLQPMAIVPAGRYTIGSPAGTGNPDEHPRHRVPLSAFYIDVCAVSNEQYERFDPSHRRLRPEVADGDRDPVVFVSYQDCLRYCRWRSEQEGLPADTYALPSEAQWEAAARGGRDDAIYPWGNEISAAICNTVESGRGRTVPINEGPGNGYGLINIGSNIREWCRDFYLPNFYSLADATRPDTAGPGDVHPGNMRVVRGASFQDKAVELGRCAARNYAHPSNSCNDIGFRCVRRKD